MVYLKHSPCDCNEKAELKTPANEEGQREGQRTQRKFLQGLGDSYDCAYAKKLNLKSWEVEQMN